MIELVTPYVFIAFFQEIAAEVHDELRDIELSQDDQHEPELAPLEFK